MIGVGWRGLPALMSCWGLSPDVQGASGVIGDELVALAELDPAVAGGGLDVPHGDVRAGHEARGLKPGEQPAVALGDAHDLGAVALAELGQRDQLATLLAILRRGDRPAVRAALRVAELRVHALDH